MSEEQKQFEWKRSTSGPPWIVIDWAGNKHYFNTEEDQQNFIERDQKMIANASRAAMADVTDQFSLNQREVQSDGE